MASPSACPVGQPRRDRAGSVAAVAAAASAGILIFVVGIATAGSTAHDTLNEMADKGLQAAHAAPPATTRW